MSAYTEVRRRASRRSLLVSVSLAVLVVGVAVLALTSGDYPLTPIEVARAVVGGGDPTAAYVVFQVRLPRVLMGILAGAALGVAGALLQALLRNPLASPELLGISGGSSLAAVTGLLLLGLTGPSLVVLAFVGGIAASALLLLAARGRAAGYRLILAGIGVSFFTAAVISFVLTRAQLQQAQSALLWITGSLSSTPWWQVLTVTVVWMCVLPLLWLLGRWIPPMLLGDEAAAGLGVRPGATRILTIVVAVLLTAATTAFIGPIAFVALCAPAIARPLIGHGGVALASSALVGASLLCASDLVAQFALPGVALPVGVVTGAFGALFLLWLLATSKGRAV